MTLPCGPSMLAVPIACITAGGWPTGVWSKFDLNKVSVAQPVSRKNIANGTMRTHDKKPWYRILQGAKALFWCGLLGSQILGSISSATPLLWL